MSFLDKCVLLVDTKWNQKNEWKVAVHYAIAKESDFFSSIAILIRNKKCSVGWDGICNTEKEFKTISRRVSETKKRLV